MTIDQYSWFVGRQAVVMRIESAILGVEESENLYHRIGIKKLGIRLLKENFLKRKTFYCSSLRAWAPRIKPKISSFRRILAGNRRNFHVMNESREISILVEKENIV